MITEKEITDLGFVVYKNLFVYTFHRNCLCICVIKNKWSFLNYFRKEDAQKWVLTISALNSQSDSLVYNIRTAEDVKEIIDNFEPDDKKTNRFIAKFISIVVFCIIFAMILKWRTISAPF